MRDSKKDLPQVRIIHISDVHFGSSHICNPPDPSGARAGIPLMEELIVRDLSPAEWIYPMWGTARDDRRTAPLFIVVTGDLTQGALSKEFNRAHDFLTYLTSKPLLETTLSLNHLFLVPGNHDVLFKEKNVETRFQPYCTFYNEIFSNLRPAVRPVVHPDESFALTQIHTRPEAKLVVAEINSCVYVEKDTEDESRGQVDFDAITKLRKQNTTAESDDSENPRT